MTILVADDELETRRLHAAILRRTGHRVLEAVSGEEALSVVAQGQVSLLLLDVRIGGVDALDVLRQLRNRPGTRTLPVLLLAREVDVGERIRCLEAGASDYVAKPVHPDELLARVQAQLRVQAAWRHVVEGTLRERAAVADALCRVRPEATPELTAQGLCSELQQLRNLAGAALLAFSGGVVPLAVDGAIGGLTAGLPVDPARAAALRARAREGPWIERDADLDSVLAYAPLTNRGHLVGLLAIRAALGGPGLAADPVADTLAAAIDFAAIAAALLAPALEQRTERGVSRAVLEQVISERAFTPFFQPILHLASHRVVGFEVLTRFADGRSPEQRFTDAARVGMGHELEQATIEAALHEARRLPAGVWIGINVSPDMLLSGALATLATRAKRPVVIELTEREAIDDYDLIRRAIEGLGPDVRLSVDDAGSGFASLRHILRLGPAFIKLDRSWVTGIDSDPARQALVVGLGFFAHETGSKLVAEGIEREDDLLMLRRLGAGLGQGFLLGRPMTVAEASRSFLLTSGAEE